MKNDIIAKKCNMKIEMINKWQLTVTFIYARITTVDHVGDDRVLNPKSQMQFVTISKHDDVFSLLFPLMVLIITIFVAAMRIVVSKYKIIITRRFIPCQLSWRKWKEYPEQLTYNLVIFVVFSMVIFTS